MVGGEICVVKKLSKKIINHQYWPWLEPKWMISQLKCKIYVHTSQGFHLFVCVCVCIQAERDKSSLASKVEELQMQLVMSRQALSQQEDRVGSLTQQLEAVQSSKQHNEEADNRGDDETENGDGGDAVFDYEVDTKSKEVLEARMRSASEELLKLRDELSQAGTRYNTLEQRYKQEKDRWRAEAQELADKIRQCIKSSKQDQERISELEKEIGATRKVAIDSEGHLSVAQEELLAFSEELSNLYHHICVCNNLTPKRVTLDYYRDGARASGGGASARRSHFVYPQHTAQKKPRANEMFISKAAALQFMGEVDSAGASGDSPNCPGSPTLDFRDPSNVRNLVAVIRCQIKHLRVRRHLSHRVCQTIDCELRVIISTSSLPLIARLLFLVKAFPAC